MKWSIRHAAWIAAAAALGWILGVVAVGATRRDAGAAGNRLSDPATIETVTGVLTATALGRLKFADSEDQLAVLLLRGKDVLTCEDLGRQVRRLQRAIASRGLSLVVWSDPDGRGIVETWLKRERIRAERHITADLRSIVRGRESLATPAVLLVESDGRVVQGVAHPVRVPNVRPRSFAEELGLAS